MNTQPEPWRERLSDQGEDPRTFLLMAQTLGQMMDVADKGLAPAGAKIVAEQAASVDWGQAYHTAPRVMTQVARSFDPTLGDEPPSDDRAVEPWLRDTMDKLKGFMQKADSQTDQRTGLFTDEAMRTDELKAVLECVLPQLGRFLVELKAATDHVFAIMMWGTTMRELLAQAEAGDDAALFKVLSLNPLLAYHAGIARRIQQATANQEHHFLQQLHKALEHSPPLHKNAKAGFIMVVLWEAGLKRLTYSEIREFLMAVGLQEVPSPQALERYGQRLGLKKYYVEPRTNTGHEDE
jgi:hypothetical protein